MSEIRETLKPLLNKRVQIRGTFAKWEDHWLRNHRQVGRVCITQPEIEGQVVAQYVWVVAVPHWKQFRDAVGSQVIFDAVVQSYSDRVTQKTNYCLGNAGELTVLHWPALAIPDPPHEEDVDEKRVEPKPAPASEPQLTPLEKIRQITAWAKASGGYEQLEKVLENMPPMPVSELLEYVRAMKN
jgi:hypothetical protein